MSKSSDKAPEDPKAPGADNQPVEDGTYTAIKKRYFAEEDIEANVGDGGLTLVKYKAGAEIKDQPLALTMIDQGHPIEVREEPKQLQTTYLNPNCPRKGRWQARPDSKLVEA